MLEFNKRTGNKILDKERVKIYNSILNFKYAASISIKIFILIIRFSFSVNFFIIIFLSIIASNNSDNVYE